MSWHIVAAVAQRVVPIILAALIALMADAALLDGELADALVRVLRGL